MSDSRTYPLSSGQFYYLQANLGFMLQSKGCDSIRFSGRESGTLSFHHPVPLSDGRFAMNYSYDAQSQRLSVQITDSPSILSEDRILAEIGNRLTHVPDAWISGRSCVPLRQCMALLQGPRSEGSMQA
jgi:hypothetical protein